MDTDGSCMLWLRGDQLHFQRRSVFFLMEQSVINSMCARQFRSSRTANCIRAFAKAISRISLQKWMVTASRAQSLAATHLPLARTCHFSTVHAYVDLQRLPWLLSNWVSSHGVICIWCHMPEIVNVAVYGCAGAMAGLAKTPAAV